MAIVRGSAKAGRLATATFRNRAALLQASAGLQTEMRTSRNRRIAGRQPLVRYGWRGGRELATPTFHSCNAPETSLPGSEDEST